MKKNSPRRNAYEGHIALNGPNLHRTLQGGAAGFLPANQ